MTNSMTARWTVAEDPEALTVRVELWNKHGVTLVMPKDGKTSGGAMLWGPDAAHELDQLAPDAFKRWLDLTQGRRQ
jgi:hypothetical protein